MPSLQENDDSPGLAKAATLCLVLVSPLIEDKRALPEPGAEVYEAQYADNGEVVGVTRFLRVSHSLDDGPLKGGEVFANATAGRLDVRVCLAPDTARKIFGSLEFEQWDDTIETVFKAALQREVPDDWKARCGQLLTFERRGPRGLPEENVALNEHALEWLRMLGRSETVAYPARLKDAVLISAPHALGLKPSCRAACLVVRERPDTKAYRADLALSQVAKDLLTCWAHSIEASALLSELGECVFNRLTLSEYLASLNLKAGTRARLSQYEAKVLHDRGLTIELLVKTRAVQGQWQKVSELRYFQELLKNAPVLPVGKESAFAYLVAMTVHAAIYSPFDQIAEAVQTIETKERAFSEYLQDAASAHVERSNWSVQMWMTIMTIVTILFGAASLYFDWHAFQKERAEESAHAPKNAIGASSSSMRDVSP